MLALAGTGFLASLTLHVALLARAASAPVPPWSWLLHAGAVVVFWWTAGRIRQARLTGLSGILRVRRMVPIPVRLCLAAVTLNWLLTLGHLVSGSGIAGRSPSAYWMMMYFLVSILIRFVVLRADSTAP